MVGFVVVGVMNESTKVIKLETFNYITSNMTQKMSTLHHPVMESPEFTTMNYTHWS